MVTKAEQKIIPKLTDLGSVLDIGCGEGRLTCYLAKETGSRITGVDLSELGFRKAKKEAYREGVGDLVRCVRSDARHLKFPDNKYDTVIFSYSLHHIENPVAALLEVHRVLKPRGRLIVFEYGARNEENKGCRLFDTDELINYLQSAHFKEISSDRIGDELVMKANAG